MKRTLNSMLALLAIALVFGLSSCNKANNPVDSSTTVDGAELTIPAFDAGYSSILDATMDKEMCVNPPKADFGVMQFGLPVRELRLTKEQMDSIKPIMMVAQSLRKRHYGFFTSF